MKAQHYKGSVTPGREVTGFSRDEVAKALFVAYYGGEPTDGQVSRLHFTIDDGYSGPRGEPWLLNLTLTDVLSANATLDAGGPQ